jgi:2-keto-3-deoxy-6-phosphogluconate aldolase
MIILKGKKSSVQEGITNYDKVVSSSVAPKIVNALQDQYTNNLKTAGTMMDTRHFAYAQACGALIGIINNLDIINVDKPTKAVRSLIVILQKTKDDIQKELSGLKN